VKNRNFLLAAGLVTITALVGCSTYGDTLVGGGGTATGTGTGTGTGGATGTTTSGTPCTDVVQCTANVTECQQPVCQNGYCGVQYTSAGTASTKQTAGDCLKVVCDGQGNPSPQPDDDDKPDDGNDCTIDGCDQGAPFHQPQPKGTACTQLAGGLCTDSGACVECLSSSDCPSSGVCTNNKCAAAGCTDKVKNGTETDVDCGGTCSGCAAGKVCGVDADCASKTCASGLCKATCTDVAKNGAETDVDCGGADCGPCASGKLCLTGTDCETGRCTGGKCADVLLISQVQTRGDAGGNDEFVELYNPTSVPVVFDSSWVLKARSAIVPSGGACTTLSLSTRFAGTGQTIPPHGHILYTNATVPPYNGAVVGDGTYTTGIPDAASVILLHGNDIVDALCFYFDTSSQTALTTCSAAYSCEGAPVLNPHANTSSSNTDASLERLPGGASGNTQDTGHSDADFKTSSTVLPHNLASAPVP
jgi:hypothetical protein